MLATSTGSPDLISEACTPNLVHWTWDTYMCAKSPGAATVCRGGHTWFFITADYAFGHAMEADIGKFVRGAGGRVLGSVRMPFPGTTDFSSFCRCSRAAPR
jgi:branched-chain amino acid transport system substrate-binding protein